MSHQSDLIATDIDAYLAEHENKGLLRLLTCGSVDDGKSTLIGRLLHDSQLIYEDQMADLEADSATMGSAGERVDLALLMDGLKAEREQGITIDVAYRYFSTSRRKFIIADTPGHEQYTRNMVTGASTCELAVVLVDGALKPEGGAHGIEKIARHRRIGGPLIAQGVQRRDVGEDAVKLALRRIPLADQHRVARRGADLKARVHRGDGAMVALRIGDDLAAQSLELAVVLGDRSLQAL